MSRHVRHVYHHTPNCRCRHCNPTLGDALGVLLGIGLVGYLAYKADEEERRRERVRFLLGSSRSND